LPAINSNIWPTDIAIDNNGNLYIGDDGNSAVRKVDRNGLMTVVAGFGGSDFYKTGDGGPARISNLGYPTGVATDNAGNVYIADYGSCRVRKITY
jgi:NHL repeat/Beta-propeller repeat